MTKHGRRFDLTDFATHVLVYCAGLSERLQLALSTAEARSQIDITILFRFYDVQHTDIRRVADARDQNSRPFNHATTYAHRLGAGSIGCDRP